MRPLHRAFGTVLSQLFFGKPGDHNRQLMRRQRIGVVKHRSHRQVLAADRPIDDHLQTFDGGESINRAPIAACTIVIDYEHVLTSACWLGLKKPSMR